MSSQWWRERWRERWKEGQVEGEVGGEGEGEVEGRHMARLGGCHSGEDREAHQLWLRGPLWASQSCLSI